MQIHKSKIFGATVLGIAVYMICSSFMGNEQHVKIPNEKLVPFPEGYRKWQHVKTAVVEPGNPAFTHFGGFHHIYANDKALEGYKTGHFPDGSILVFDVLEAIDTNKLLLEGRRRQIDVMVRDSVQFAATGGWGFEEFNGDSKVDRKVKDSATKSCYSCHANKKTLVFSELRP